MDFLTEIWNYIKTTFFGESKPPEKPKVSKKTSIFPAAKKQEYKIFLLFSYILKYNL